MEAEAVEDFYPVTDLYPLLATGYKQNQTRHGIVSHTRLQNNCYLVNKIQKVSLNSGVLLCCSLIV